MKNIIKIALRFGLTLPFYIIALWINSLSKTPKWEFVKQLSQKISEKCGKTINMYGYPNVPNENIFVVSNHRSMIDPVFINHSVKQHIAFAMKKDLDRGIPKMLAKCTGSKFLYRTPKEDLNTIKEMIIEAKGGKNFAVFPEGKRNYDYSVLPFSAGLFKIPIRARSTIIPVVVFNTESVIEKVNDKEVLISFLNPIEYEKYSQMNTIQLSEHIHNLIEQEYIEISKIADQ